MKDEDPLADWRKNPFFVLGLGLQASRVEIERAGQKLLGLMALGSASAGRCDTPLGPATRDADDVRQALASLRNPGERVVHELLADLGQGPRDPADERRSGAWAEGARAIGWFGRWPE
jgi:hypothetical protein